MTATNKNFTAAERAEIAQQFDGYADGLLRVAADLEAQGHDIAAEIQRNTAAVNREVAQAARDSNAREANFRLNEIFNG